MRRIVTSVLAVFSLGATLAGCAGGSGGCTSPSDCEEGYICLFSECIKRSTGGCATETDCPAGFTCSNGSCIGKTACAKDADCPGGQHCVSGKCESGTPTGCTKDVDCPGGTCNEGTGKCEYPQPDCSANGECDDGDPCTLDTCEGGQCAHAADPEAGCCTSAAQCGDANPCTIDGCTDGQCTHTPKADCCSKDPDCDDGVTCTEDVCISAKCYHPRKTSPQCPCAGTSDCDDGNPCSIDKCLNQQCSYDKNPNSPSIECCLLDSACDDQDPATDDTCTELFLCDHQVHEPCTADAACDDGNPCTDDTCQSGECVNSSGNRPGCCTEDAHCNDNNAATIDHCQSNSCVHLECESDAHCDDANPATFDHCQSNACAHWECELDAHCDDGDPCTTDACRTDHLCERTLIPECCQTVLDCDDDDDSTEDSCVAGTCVHKGKQPCQDPAECDDGFGCTDDACLNGFCERYPNLDEPACPCVNDAYCATLPAPKPAVCNIYLPDETGFVHICTLETGTKKGGQACTTDDSCQSGFCMQLTEAQLCYGACQTDADCFPGTRCGSIGFTLNTVPPKELSIDGCIPEPTVCTGDPNCAEDKTCVPMYDLDVPDTITGYCTADTGTTGAGGTCSADAECQSSWCTDLGTVSAPSMRCLGMCATSAECASGTKCYPNLIYFSFDKGTPATTDDTYDSISACLPDMGGFAPCQRDLDCPASEHCELFTNDPHTAFEPHCVTGAGYADGGASCTADDQCRSTLCIGKGQPGAFCFGLCTSSADCDWGSSTICTPVELIVNDRGTPDDESDDIKAQQMVCVPF
jgi:hypothetical protein